MFLLEYTIRHKGIHEEITVLVNWTVYCIFQEKYCNTGAQNAEELDKLKHQVHIFKHYMHNFLMPWILDTPQNSELDEYNEVILELANKVEKIREVRRNTSQNMVCI
jgi:hypothetical protein